MEEKLRSVQMELTRLKREKSMALQLLDRQTVDEALVIPPAPSISLNTDCDLKMDDANDGQTLDIWARIIATRLRIVLGVVEQEVNELRRLNEHRRLQLNPSDPSKGDSCWSEQVEESKELAKRELSSQLAAVGAAALQSLFALIDE
jgi:hypothetical protein